MYLIQVSISWAVFYTLYWLLLRKETFFVANRIYLMATLLLGLVLPLDFSKIWWQQVSDESAPIMVYLQPLIVGSKQLEKTVQTSPISTWQILYYIYSIGVVVLSVRLVYGFYQLYQTRRQSQITRRSNYFLAKTKEIHLPFSFFNTVFWSASINEKEDGADLMLRHEIAHIQQKHSIDVVFLEILSILFWCSPIVYFYKKSLRAVHEYLADEAASITKSKKEYGTILIRQLQSGLQPTLANSFISSQIKQRFTMMIKKSSPRSAYFRYVLSLPLVLLLSIFLHQESLKAQEKVTDSDGTIITKFDKFEVHDATDTIVTFNPDTFAETRQIVKSIDTIFTNLDTPAQFVGGQDSLMRFLAKNVKYPKEAREKDIGGRSVVKFKINSLGYVDKIKIAKSSGNNLLDEEALRIVNVMIPSDYRNFRPHWIPGKNAKGKEVSCYFILPINFKLEGEKK